MPDLPTLLPDAAAWQLLLAAAPAAAVAIGALAASRTGASWRAAQAASAAALGLALASLVAVLAVGSGQGFGLRADAVGAAVATLVAFIGWAIVRYSRPYLAGEPGEAGYVRWLLATLAAVHVVAASNHLLLLALAWTAASLALHRLLVFYVERPAAVLAAHKKFVLGRIADAAMLGACALLALSFGTLRIDAVLEQAAAALPLAAQCAIVLVVVAALLKCAQLPFHGWLIQVMEAPTPVSALLHAGVVNLGGFVLVRLAPLVADVPLAAGLLVAVGAFTAVVAALVMTTRISIKVALAWSTCAQMGFMLMQCGLGLWEMALLHLVAHSLYKAHAFLAAGGVVRQTTVRDLAPARGPEGAGTAFAAAALSLVMVAAVALATGLAAGAPPALWVMAGVVALALAPMLRPGSAAPWWPGALAAVLLATLYFVLHALLQGGVAPASAVPAQPWWLLAALAFGLLFALQCVVTARPDGALATRLYPWFYGGLFLDERFSRALFRLWPPKRPSAAAPLAALPHAG